MKTVIHVNRNIIQYNGKHGTNLPVCRVSQGSKTCYGRRIKINGPSEMVYNPDKPLSCGAKLWIETTGPVEIVDECSYADVQGMKKELA